jgi:hypothetical protein
MGGMMGNGIPGGMNNMPMDDPYASLLGAGAPGQNTGQINPFMGMGNPLMSMSSTNMMADQMGFSNMNGGQNGFGSGGQNSSVKSMQLQNDYERKMAERRMVDMETNQPQASNNSNNYGNQMAMMGMISGGNIQIPNMGIQNMGMQNMGMQNMGMQNMGMQNMGNVQIPSTGMQNMGMQNMGMQNIGMPNMGMQNMGMQNMGMPNMISNMGNLQM